MSLKGLKNWSLQLHIFKCWQEAQWWRSYGRLWIQIKRNSPLFMSNDCEQVRTKGVRLSETLRLGGRRVWTRVKTTTTCLWVRKGRSRRRKPQRVGELWVNYQLGFWKLSAACKWKGKIRQQSRSQEQVLGSSVVSANLLTSLLLIVMTAGVLSPWVWTPVRYNSAFSVFNNRRLVVWCRVRTGITARTQGS